MSGHIAPSFASVAQQARQRWLAGEFLSLLGRSAPAIFLPACAVLAALRLSGLPGAWLAPALAAGWVWGSAALALWRRPTAEQALAIWDERAGLHEMFLSAHVFENNGGIGEGEELHLREARRRLSDERPRLAQSFPIRLPWQAWLTPLAFAALLFSPAFLPPPLPEERSLSADERALAAKEKDGLASEAKAVEAVKELSPKDKAEAEKLQDSLRELAGKLDKASTPKELLDNLEKRARDAEKLADKIEDGQALALSEKMLSEMERHADLSPLAGALRGGNLGQAAATLDNLAKRLQGELTLEEKERLKEALQKTLAAGNEKDRQGSIGQALAKALSHLQKGSAKDAGKELADKASKLAEAEKRAAAKRQLRSLADRLRNSGQRILAQKQDGVKRLSNSASLQQTAAKAMLSPFTQNQYAGMAQAGGQTASGQQPFAGNSSASPGQQAPGSPVPGMPGSAGASYRPMPGGNGGAPVPGSKNGGQMPGMGQMPGGGQAPVPGAGGSQPGQAGQPANGAGKGGLQAGVGSAGYGGGQTKAMASSSSDTVAAAQGAGPSQTTTRETAPRNEATAREAKASASEAIKAEEEALLAEPLPLSRRGQVLKYFSLLRDKLEE